MGKRNCKTEVSQVTLQTKAFDGLSYTNKEVIATRILGLEFVDSVDKVHGTIVINCEDIKDLEERQRILEKHLSQRVAKGEKVSSRLESSLKGYTRVYDYEPGEYPLKEELRSR